MQKKERQNLYFIVINKNGGLQFFTQFKEVYREERDEKGNDQTKISSNSTLSASSIFYTIDNLTKTIIPNEVTKIEAEKEEDFYRNNSIDMLITDQYMVSCLLTMTGLRLIVLSGTFKYT